MLSEALSSHHQVVRPAAAWAPSPQRTLEEQFARAPTRTICAKEHAFAEGDRRTHLFRVESGAICLYKIMSDGRRQVLGFAYPGDLIGFGSNDAYQFNAQATKPTQLRLLSWSSVQNTARRDPTLGLKLYEAISNELSAAHDLLLTTGQRSAVERLAAFLLAMSRRARRNGQNPAALDLPMTRADIGDFLGLTIETVSRTFTKLRQQGIIELAQSAHVELLDLEELERLAEGGSDH
jgi:CRP/FNR family transcriptional regulator